MLTLLFPKETSLSGKSLDTQRTYRDIYKKYISMIVEAGCEFEVMIEDTLAHKILNELGVQPSRYITCICPSDYEFSVSFPDVSKIDSVTLSMYGRAECMSKEFEKKIPVPPDLIRKGREEYMNQRADILRKRVRAATDNLVSTRDCVFMFRMNNNNDRCMAVRDTISLGDGRLCVEIDMNSGLPIAYYGGTYIDGDVLPTVLRL